jgi:phosphate starvation-inducible PhoH-like protein
MALTLFGERNVNLKRIEQETGAQVHSRGNEVTFVGEAVSVRRARTLLQQLADMARSGRQITADDVGRAAAVLRGQEDANVSEVMNEAILVGSRARPITAKGLAQKRYVDAIWKDDIVFGIGPAGTGKTYLAIAKAVEALEAGRVARIVLSRPAVEAGESIGFLPGEMEDKLAPYLRPLYDALSDRISMKRVRALMAEGAIEIAPVGFMRGRTLNNAFVVIDEAQNCTYVQLKMLLTRLGWHSTMVVTGDPAQSDLLPELSGLATVANRLEAVGNIAVVRLEDRDIVRHPLVAEMLGVL